MPDDSKMSGEDRISRRTQSRSTTRAIVGRIRSTYGGSAGTRRSRLSALLMLVPSCFVLACGAANTPASPSSHPTSTAAITPSPTPNPTPTPSPPPGGPAPSQLSGEWIEVTVPGGLVEDMSLVGTSYRLGSASGNIRVSGNQIYFFNGPCDGVGLYRWTIHGSILHFTLLNDDPCGRRMDLDNHSYSKTTG